MAVSPTVWGIHAGATGEADNLFLDNSVVGIGWDALGNIAQVGPSRDKFKDKVRGTYLDYKPGKVPTVAGILYRFVYEMKPGDYAVYPRKTDRTLRLGRIVGDYEYRPDLMKGYPNIRKVEWVGERPRTDFSQTALYEVGSALSLFMVREHGEEILGVFSGKALIEEPGEPIADPFVSTEDFVIRRLEKQLKGAPLERFVKDLLEAMGYRCRLTKVSGDGGIDVEAARGPLGFEPPIVRAQVKSTTASISDGDVKHLFASVNTGEFGLFVTLGSYTRPAYDFARSKSNLSLIGGSELVSLILEHYEQLSPASKAHLPLRRTYVPDDSSE
jgi:restriction system protein